MDFVRSAAKKWREVGVKVVTRINLDVYQQIPLDQIGDTNEKEEILHIVLRIFRRSGKILMKFVIGKGRKGRQMDSVPSRARAAADQSKPFSATTACAQN